jgi:hypothetical protein
MLQVVPDSALAELLAFQVLLPPIVAVCAGAGLVRHGLKALHVRQDGL